MALKFHKIKHHCPQYFDNWNNICWFYEKFNRKFTRPKIEFCKIGPRSCRLSGLWRPTWRRGWKRCPPTWSDFFNSAKKRSEPFATTWGPLTRIAESGVRVQKPEVSYNIAGLPDGLFSNQKNPNLGEFLMALEWKMFLYFRTIWNILWPFGII
jgi:hypothetical protein